MALDVARTLMSAAPRLISAFFVEDAGLPLTAPARDRGCVVETSAHAQNWWGRRFRLPSRAPARPRGTPMPLSAPALDRNRRFRGAATAHASALSALDFSLPFSASQRLRGEYSLEPPCP